MKCATIATGILPVAVILSGCSMAQRAMPGATMSDANVLSVLNTIDRSEVEAARLAQQKASPEVRAFATRMIDEHQAKTQETRELGQRMDVSPDKPALAKTLEKTHRETMEELQGKSGRDFDQAYIEYQITMHEQAVDLVQETADEVKNSRLQQHLRRTRPDLERHLSAARALERQVAQR